MAEEVILALHIDRDKGDMSMYNFHLLVNQHGERFIFYKSPNGEKVIEDFSKIPYTAESLFEDITEEFSAFPWEEDDSGNEYNDNDVLVGRFVDDFTLHEARSFYMRFREIACVMVGDEAIYIELYIEQMNDNEKKLFGELKDCLTTYCQDNDIELCIWDEAIEEAK